MSDESDTGTEPDSATAAPPLRRRRRRTIAMVAAVLLLSAGATLVVLWNRDTARPVSLDEAQERVAVVDKSGDERVDEQGDEQGVDEQGVDQDVEPSGTTRPRPEAGVYQYLGEGSEHLDTPPKTQTQGPEMPGTVTHLDAGCWRLRVDYSTLHWQSWDYCVDGTTLTEHAGAFFQRLDLVVAQVDTNSSSICDPPVDAIRSDRQAGDQTIQRCTGTSTGTSSEVISSGPYTFVGEERLDIGGTAVQALHYHRLRTLSGGQNGTEDVNVWFEPDTGLPLRNTREITVHSDSLIGEVTYTESGSFELTSLTPIG